MWMQNQHRSRCRLLPAELGQPGRLSWPALDFDQGRAVAFWCQSSKRCVPWRSQAPRQGWRPISTSPGRVYRETDEEDTTLGSVVDDLLTGQFNDPVRVVAFNTSEGWSRDVSEDVAREVVRRVAEHDRPLATSSRQFVQTYVDEDELLRAENGVA